MKTLLQAAAALACLMFAVTLYFVPFYVGAITAHVDSASAAVNMTARFTIQKEAHIDALATELKGFSQAAITGIAGSDGLIDTHLQYFNNTLHSAVWGRFIEDERGRTHYQPGIVPAFSTAAQGVGEAGESLSDTIGNIGAAANSVGDLAQGIRDGYFTCPGLGCSQSRFLAITGEAMRTMDSVRLMSMESKDKLPEMLDSWSRMADAGAGIAEDGHRFTSKFMAPRPLRSKIWDGVKLGVYGAARAF